MSPDSANSRSQASLADYGHIAYYVDRLFLFLEYVMVVRRIFGLKTRKEHDADLRGVSAEQEWPELTTEKRLELVRRNARRVDYYISAFFAIEGLILIWAAVAPRNFEPRPLALAVIFICWYRIIDIIQATANRLIFSPLRDPWRHRMASSVRILVLTVLAYFEAGVCFALLYFAWGKDLRGSTHTIGDCLYFSGITQLTIGYGDITPMHGLRFIAISQGLLGFFLAVVIVARLIAELPKISGDLEQRLKNDEKY